MDNTHLPTAHHGHAEPNFSTKAIWKTFWILLIITCIELVIGMFIAPHFNNLKLMFNILYMFLTLLKAYFIVAEFMHLRHELKTLIMSIVVPLFLFVWFTIAFLWDGHSWRMLRNNYDPYHVEQSKQPAQKHDSEHGHEHDATKPGEMK
jgi:cytochrome c oxidase subunit IV